MKFAVVPLALCAACGRVGFDPLAADGDVVRDTSTACGVTDNFNDNDADGWTTVEGAMNVTSSGPDASGALHTPLADQFSFVTHPSITGVTSATLDADFVINAGVNGDFDVLFAGQGWTSPEGPFYFFELSPIGSDNPEDDLFLLRDNMPTNFQQKPVVITTGTYHHVQVSVIGSALTLSLDGVVHLAATDTQLAPPYDVLIGFYNEGAVDNINVTCTR